MLYDALHEPVLKKGYQVKYVPVYRSESGEVVSEDEATFPGIRIAEVAGAKATAEERDSAIKKLVGIMLKVERGAWLVVDTPKLQDAIKAMALEPALKLQVGKLFVQDVFPYEFAVSLLVDSGLKEAIVPLTKLMTFAWDNRNNTSFLDHSDIPEDVQVSARTALRKLLANTPDPEFRYEAALEAFNIHEELSRQMSAHRVAYSYNAEKSRQVSACYADFLKSWATELLYGLVNSTAWQDWARERLKELEATG